MKLNPRQCFGNGPGFDVSCRSQEMFLQLESGTPLELSQY